MYLNRFQRTNYFSTKTKLDIFIKIDFESLDKNFGVFVLAFFFNPGKGL